MIKLKDMQVFEILTKLEETEGRTNKINYLMYLYNLYPFDCAFISEA